MFVQVRRARERVSVRPAALVRPSRSCPGAAPT